MISLTTMAATSALMHCDVAAEPRPSAVVDADGAARGRARKALLAGVAASALALCLLVVAGSPRRGPTLTTGGAFARAPSADGLAASSQRVVR